MACFACRFAHYFILVVVSAGAVHARTARTLSGAFLLARCPPPQNGACLVLECFRGEGAAIVAAAACVTANA
jgi:hypothetical protein